MVRQGSLAQYAYIPLGGARCINKQNNGAEGAGVEGACGVGERARKDWTSLLRDWSGKVISGKVPLSMCF